MMVTSHFLSRSGECFVLFTLLFLLLFSLPFQKFRLTFLAFPISLNIRPETSGDRFDHMIRIRGFVDRFFSSCHYITDL